MKRVIDLAPSGLTQERAHGAAAGEPEGVRLPLSAAQHGIWLGQQLEPASPRYNAAECIEMRGELQLPAFESALHRALDEAEVLRARVVDRGDGPVQCIGNALQWSLSVIDLDAQADSWSAARAWMLADLQRPIDLTRGPLFRAALLRAAPGHYFWYLAAHHIALDGFAFALIARRVAELYSAAVERASAPVCSFGPLAAVVDEDLAYRAGPQFALDRAFWTERLADMAAPASLSRRSAFASESTLRSSTRLSADSKARLDALAKLAHGTWGDALIAALASYLHAETGAREIVLGLPMMGRLGSRALRVPCMAMNIVPLRLAIDSRDSFVQLIGQVVGELRRLRPHARYRYEQLRRDLKLVGRERRLFGPVLNLMPFDYQLQFAGLQATVHNVSAGPVEDISIGLHARDGRGLELYFEANPLCYDRRELERHRRSFVRLLFACTAAGERTLADLVRPRSSVSSASESVFSGEPLVHAARCVVAQFREQVSRAPDAIALEQAGESLTYQELATAARSLAARIAARVGGEDALVVIALPRGFDAITAIWAVLMAGAAYLPLDPNGPTARSAAILTDAQPALVLTYGRYLARLGPLETQQTLLLDRLPAEPDDDLLPVQLPQERLAYAIYTSGSTGRPNGVLIERAALAHFVAAATQRYGVTSGDRVLQFAPLQFDASVEEIFVTLCAGATLLLRSEDMLQSVPRFVSACSAARITILDLPTAFWHELAYCMSSGAAQLPDCVRIVIIGGEAALRERVQRFCAAAPATTKLFNTYGPTEATVVATSAVLSGEGALAIDDDVPIGLPLPGSSALIISESGALAAAGAVGELCLLGPALARGYLRRPELEQQRFVSIAQLPGEPRAYRTGDLVRRRADGQLVFVGRLDDELKISGQRVDPSEVEGVLLRYPGVREACVVAQPGDGGSRRLLAYLVADPLPPLPALRRHAQLALLPAAVPTAFTFLEVLPKSSSGKLDRAALRHRLAPEPTPASVAASELEQLLLRVWEEVLGASGLALDDDFFERGGQSLQTIQVASRLTAQLGREVPVALLFRFPTVAELARAIEEPGQRSLAAKGLPETLLSDTELADDVVLPRSAAQVAAKTPARVLLTGATGFVGAHLLRELLDETAARVVCLVRARDRTDAKARLLRAQQEHGLAPLDLDARIEALPCDLTKPRLGLDASTSTALAADVDAIYHSAAVVSLTRGYASLRAVNVQATEELLRLAMRDRAKAFHHVSTLAVAPGIDLADQVPEEFFAAHGGLRDGYTQSKWAAERLVQQARARGLDARIYRLGRVVGPVDSGFVNADDIVWRLLRAAIPAGCLPALDVSESWTPVDFVARAIIASSLRPPGCAPIYHVAPSAPVHLAQIFAWVEEYGYALERLSVARWQERVRSAGDVESTATLAFFDLQTGGDEPRALGLGQVQSDALRSALGERALECPSIDRAAVHRNLDFCVRAGLLPPPARSTVGDHS